MVRILAAIVVLSTAGRSAAAELRWYGQSFFQLTTASGLKVVFDPHYIEEYDSPRVPADVAVVSHPHQDHNQIEALPDRQKVKVFQGLTGQGRVATWNNVSETIKGVKITTLPAKLGTFHDAEKGAKRGKNGVFIIEADGLRFVHLGDLGHKLSDAQVKSLGRVDVLMIPVGGIYSINGEQAAEVVRQIKPTRYIVPMHYGTPRYDYLSTPAEFFFEVEDDFPLQKLTKSNVLKIDPKAKGKKPTVVQLGWKP